MQAARSSGGFGTSRSAIYVRSVERGGNLSVVYIEARLKGLRRGPCRRCPRDVQNSARGDRALGLFVGSTMQNPKIGCFLMGACLFFISSYFDEALARPDRKLSQHEKRQSDNVAQTRPRASGRASVAPPSGQNAAHPQSKQIAVEPTTSPVHQHEAQGQRFRLPSSHRTSTLTTRPLARQNSQSPVRNSIGVSIPSASTHVGMAPPGGYSRATAPGTLSVQHGTMSGIGSGAHRPVTPGGPARIATTLPSPRSTAGIGGTAIMHRGNGPSQIGGPAR